MNAAVVVVVVALVLLLPAPAVICEQQRWRGRGREPVNYWKMLSVAGQRYSLLGEGGYSEMFADHHHHHQQQQQQNYSGVELFHSYGSSEEGEEDHQMLAAAQLLSSSSDICDGVSTLNVSKKCCEDTKLVLASLVQKERWALQMLDSYGKIPSGILLGDFTFPGSYDECKSIKVAVRANLTREIQKYQAFSTRYCQLIIPNENLKMMMAFGAVPGIHLGMCVPDSCSEEDMNILIYTGIHLLPFNGTKNVTAYTTCEHDLEYDSKAIFSLVVSSLYLLLIVSGTLYDVISSHLKSKKDVSTGEEEEGKKLPPMQNGTSVSQQNLVETQDGEEPSLAGKLLLCFSVYHNGAKVLNTGGQSEGTLSCIHGIRFLSMTWVLLGHVYVFGISVFRNPKSLLNFVKQFAFQAIANATVSVDSFFLLSGLLVAYSTMKVFKARDGKMNWIYFYVHRYWRLTPPILLVMMVYIPMFRYMSSGPYWPEQGTEVNFCRDSWFYNILYINNFLPSQQTGMCMGWLWYLANDMQFYWISPLLLIPLYKWPKIGHVIVAVLLLAHFICTGIIATVDKASFNMLAANQVDTFKDIYVKPYTRIGPYLVGLMYGYYLFTTQCKLYINKYVNAMLWLMATISATAVLYGLYNANNGASLTQETMSFYTAVNRSVWGVSLGWVVFACCTGNGGFVNTILSWKAFIPLSRLTYCAYLVHPIILFYFFFSQRYPLAPTQITFVFLFFGCFGVTFVIAFMASMAFEAPMLGLEKVLLQKLKIRK